MTFPVVVPTSARADGDVTSEASGFSQAARTSAARATSTKAARREETRDLSPRLFGVAGWLRVDTDLCVAGGDHEHAVERAHVGLGTGDDDVRIGGATGVGFAVLFNADGDLALGVDTLGDAFHAGLG